MRITNCGQGVHPREVAGVDKLRGLPANWYAYTNLDVVLKPGESREIDVVLICDDRIFLVDLKDWNGVVTSSSGNWVCNGRDYGPSPVAKISALARELSILLKGDIKRHAKGKWIAFPRVLGVVVMTGKADISGVAASEAQSVFPVDAFLRAVSTEPARRATFGPVAQDFQAQPLTAGDWKHRLSNFFNVRNGYVRPGVRRYGTFRAQSEAATFEHASGVFAEFNAEDVHTPQSLATVRLWDFAKADTRFQSVEGRSEIAGRERAAIAYLEECSAETSTYLLRPITADPEHGVGYWEVFERRRRLQRLSDYARIAETLNYEVRIELARQTVSALAHLHRAEAAHLDLGPHSVWFETPSTIRLSHLMAAKYPQGKSLGAARYEFLSSAEVPEGQGSTTMDDARRRDVFLLGDCVHRLLFGRDAGSEGIGGDTSGDDAFGHLRTWFDRALAKNPADRFADAQEALRAFNKATTTHPSTKKAVAGLERFGSTLKSQRQLSGVYPDKGTLRESVRLDVWRSEKDGRAVIVKLWKSAAWGDLTKEGARILDFLVRADEEKLSPTPGSSRVLDLHWLGDAFALIVEDVAGTDLAHSVDRLSSWRIVVPFLLRVARIVEARHARGLAHGDLKPSNIIVSDTPEAEPTLIDYLDFAPSSDGEIMTSAYAPAVGGRLERDRFAVGKIAEELVAPLPDGLEREAILAAIRICRDNDPANGTLLPLIEALERLLAPLPTKLEFNIDITLKSGDTGAILADEGKFFVRPGRDVRSWVLRGASEELEISCDNSGLPIWATRRRVDQKKIARFKRDEFFEFSGAVVIRGGQRPELSTLMSLLQDEAFRRAATAAPRLVVSEDADDAGPELDPLSDETADVLTESIVNEPTEARVVDVRRLWRHLMDAESALTTEGVAQADSRFDRDRNRHAAPFELISGTFEFDAKRGDRVGVEKLDRRGEWRRIGELDIGRSRPDLAFIKSDAPRSARLLEVDQRVRFVSHFELQSRRRRDSAISRILADEARIPNLQGVFSKTDCAPEEIEVAISEAALSRYGLNDTQERAFCRLLRTRPLGLLQGPPGTGKTKFIAALAHFAISQGLARNVLLASQSHEAVNTAAEAILKLHQNEQGAPSLLRVGNETVVSEALMPFHSERVELAIKEKFKAQQRERLSLAGDALGVPSELADRLFVLETQIRILVERIAAMESAGDVESARRPREHLERVLANVAPGVEFDAASPLNASECMSAYSRQMRRAFPSVSADAVDRYRQVAQLARDFTSSAPAAQRSLEPFLAGTRSIVVGTCVGLGRPSLGLTSTAFDLVIIDEAARCTASELAVPMQAGRWIVLVGDHAQLEPQHPNTIVDDVAKEVGVPRREVVKSDFERVFSMPYGRNAGATLTTQYRMLAPIGRVVSRVFYDNTLEHGRADRVAPDEICPTSLSHALTWIATDGLGLASQQRPDRIRASFNNPAELNVILALLEQWSKHDAFLAWIEKRREAAHAIGIICTYASQRDLLRRRIHGSGLHPTLLSSIKIDTVDAYQGKENPIVILSLVRNNLDGAQAGGVATIKEGFLARPHRINVAVSRAMDRLVIVGAQNRWRDQSPLGKLVAAFRDEESTGEARTLPATEIVPETPEPSPKKRATSGRGRTS